MTRDVFIRIPFMIADAAMCHVCYSVRGTIYIFGVGFEVAYLYKVASSKAKNVR